eukprot:TRINITY_DN13470_c0_g1_i1.p1 TRINITY_DN13470_c0_g1~~TRINITY_DN13470_c0_g1_i1.p1  ORF type:complete len:257 (+),score=13.78 TRINITY_DN13470_c0_g1_i1:57-773(+)
MCIRDIITAKYGGRLSDMSFHSSPFRRAGAPYYSPSYDRGYDPRVLDGALYEPPLGYPPAAAHLEGLGSPSRSSYAPPAGYAPPASYAPLAGDGPSAGYGPSAGRPAEYAAQAEAYDSHTDGDAERDTEEQVQSDAEVLADALEQNAQYEQELETVLGERDEARQAQAKAEAGAEVAREEKQALAAQVRDLQSDLDMVKDELDALRRRVRRSVSIFQPQDKIPPDPIDVGDNVSSASR